MNLDSAILIRIATDILYHLELDGHVVFHVVLPKETPFIDVREYLHIYNYEQLFAFLQLHVTRVRQLSPGQPVSFGLNSACFVLDHEV